MSDKKKIYIPITEIDQPLNQAIDKFLKETGMNKRNMVTKAVSKFIGYKGK